MGIPPSPCCRFIQAFNPYAGVQETVSRQMGDRDGRREGLCDLPNFLVTQCLKTVVRRIPHIRRRGRYAKADVLASAPALS